MKISFTLILLLSLTFTELNAQKNNIKSKSDSIVNPLLKSETQKQSTNQNIFIYSIFLI